MRTKFEKIDKAFDFFLSCRQTKQTFSLNDLKDATGWGISTVKTYSTKRWQSFLKNVGNNRFSVLPKFDTFTPETFRQHHSQKDKVNKFFYQLLIEKAINACVSAIEIYNKPDFKFREESFSILMINSWELLLKAKILKENADRQESIQVYKSGSPVLTTSGNFKTISILKALQILEGSGEVNSVVASSIRLLIEIRNESVHFVHNDLTLSTRVQAVGTASLKNFMTLAMRWFGYDFQKFNFYLMPVSFYHLSDVDSFSLDNNAQSNLVNYLDKVEKQHEADDDPVFSISLRLETRLVKTSSDEAIHIRLTNDPSAPELQISEEDSLKSYPYTYLALCKKLRERYKDFKQNQIFHSHMKRLSTDGEKFCKKRRLDPNNLDSTYKFFYHSRILEEFDKYYSKKC